MFKKSIFYLLVFACCTQVVNGQGTCNPVITYNNNYNLCEGFGVLELTVATGIPAGCQHLDPFNPYKWISPGGSMLSNANQESFSSPVAGDYQVEITLTGTNCPCTGTHVSNIIEVKEVPDPPLFSTQPLTSCGNAVDVVASVSQQNGIGTYSWYNSNGDLIYTGKVFNTGALTQSVTYNVTYTVNQCESAPASVSVLYSPLPSPIINSDTIDINCNNIAELRATPASSGQINWYSDINLSDLVNIGSQFNTGILENSQDFYVATSNNGCLSPPQTIHVNVIETPKPVVSDQFACKGEELVLTANAGQGSLGTTVFQWERNNIVEHTGSQYAVSKSIFDTPGVYSFQVKAINNNCISDSASQKLTIYDLPVLNVDTNYLKVCERESITINAFSDPGIGISTVWYGPGGNLLSRDNELFIEKSVRALHNGLFVVEGTGANNCANTEMVDIEVVAGPNVGLIPRDTIIDGEFIQLSASGGDEYQWQYVDSITATDIPNPFFFPPSLSSGEPETHHLIVEVIDYDNACSAIDTATITVVPNSVEDIDGENLVKVYDLITPDGNGKNEYLEIDYLYNLGEQYKIHVFDKYNQLIFIHDSSTDGKYEGDAMWNGCYKDNNPVPTGAYRYVIKYTEGEISGLVTVLNNQE